VISATSCSARSVTPAAAPMSRSQRLRAGVARGQRQR
jgi:hypothetical protein